MASDFETYLIPVDTEGNIISPGQDCCVECKRRRKAVVTAPDIFALQYAQLGGKETRPPPVQREASTSSAEEELSQVLDNIWPLQHEDLERPPPLVKPEKLPKISPRSLVWPIVPVEPSVHAQYARDSLDSLDESLSPPYLSPPYNSPTPESPPYNSPTPESPGQSFSGDLSFRPLPFPSHPSNSSSDSLSQGQPISSPPECLSQTSSVTSPSLPESSSADSISKKTKSRKVSFNDEIGMPLTTVRVMEDTEEVFFDSLASRLMDLSSSLEEPEAPQMKLELGFIQPASKYQSFLDKVETYKVSLENIRTEAEEFLGIIRVINLDFQKEVTVRYTINGWQSYTDVGTTYVPKSKDSNGHYDLFSFRISVATSHTFSEEDVQFAIRYRVAGQEYWDNNGGSNYGLRSVAVD